MLGETNGPKERPLPEGHLGRCLNPKEAGSLNAGVYMFIDAVDAHYKKARAAGADILLEPADMHWGDRIYCAADPEGQFWMFATRITNAGSR